MARHHFETAIQIEASAARVWAILTDFPRMPSWNPFILSIAGEPVFSALLVSLARRTLTATKTGFDAMNSALKREAERK
jgi:hypothetical protein